MEWHSFNEKEVLRKIGSSELGLSEHEVDLRLKRYGKNIIKEMKKINPLLIFFEQFLSLFIYILAASAII